MRGRLVAGALVAAAVVLIASDTLFGLDPLTSAGATLAGPVERLLGRAPTDAQVRALEQDNTRLRAALWTGSPPQQVREGTVTAQVVAYGGRQGYADTVTIDAGTRQGVRQDLTVLDRDGLIGRVIAVGPDTATVLLATDATATIGARLAGSGEIGTVTGTGLRGTGLLRLRVLNSRADVRPGQQVVTFGSRKALPYAPGVPIGTVTEVESGSDPLTRTALVRPAARFTALDVVGVVVPS
ncbi:rod shape-determining protein MreC [Nonomuraea sediminis]|uniref:rod shape-determining protein MreC n=1 Tax=Nonomuraea sediminis TaxID=2835864 RepID=UPI001BDD13F8|nr:rod shape-determining protein MreC [Nonomuraea sediminis]